MTIPDPRAIPETSATCADYVKEADALWDAGDNDVAYELYNSARNSSFVTAEQYNHVNLRLGLIAETRGDIDKAVSFFHASHDPAAHDALQALTNATTHDRDPDPTVVPETAEEAFAWIEAALTAEGAKDWQRAHDFYEVILQATVLTPGQLGTAYSRSGIALEQLGRPDEAKARYEQSLSLLADNDQLAYAHGRIKELGGGDAAPDDDTAASAQVAAGLTAYENSDATAARTAFQAALHLDGTVDEKGRAHYYIAAMDYQENHFADSRNHLEAALKDAPEPERSWAQGMLAWRWDEQPATATGQAPSAAAGEIDLGY
jgi:tetratricopeptide (TPR) repeat protein